MVNALKDLEARMLADSADWAMIDGIRAFRQDARRDENPFGLDDYSFLAWDDGWMAANAVAAEVATAKG